MVNITIQNPQIPLLILVGFAVLIFYAARYLKISNSSMAIICALAILTALLYGLFESNIISLAADDFSTLEHSPGSGLSPSAFYPHEPGAALLSLLIYGLAFLVSIYNAEYMKPEDRQHTFYPLILLMVCGMVGMLYSANLMGLYLFCELMSICAYTLVAFRRKDETAIEAGFKYLIMGSVASVIILLGIGLLFLAYGEVNITSIAPKTGWASQLGGLLMLAGFSLKCALVPMHTWLPDAHEKAPSSVVVLSGLLVHIVLYVMIKIDLALGIDPWLLGTILLILAMLNIWIGNLMGLVQLNLKRMLGYSTVAQMGYITLCMAVGLRNESLLALQSSIYIIIAHACAKGLAFFCTGIFSRYLDVHQIKDLKKTEQLSAFSTIPFYIAVISLSSLPPFPGFTGKWIALTAFFASGDPLTVIITLSLLMGSLISFGYYLPPLVKMLVYFQRQRKEAPVERKKTSLWMGIPVTILVCFILAITLSPQFIIDGTTASAQFLLELMR